VAIKEKTIDEQLADLEPEVDDVAEVFQIN
jgi:hypothetical protein